MSDKVTLIIVTEEMNYAIKYTFKVVNAEYVHLHGNIVYYFYEFYLILMSSIYYYDFHFIIMSFIYNFKIISKQLIVYFTSIHIN